MKDAMEVVLILLVVVGAGGAVAWASKPVDQIPGWAGPVFVSMAFALLTIRHAYRLQVSLDGNREDPFDLIPVAEQGFIRVEGLESYGSMAVRVLRPVKKVSVRVEVYSKLVRYPEADKLSVLRIDNWKPRYLAWSSPDRVAAYGTHQQWLDFPASNATRHCDVAVTARSGGTPMFVCADHNDRPVIDAPLSMATLLVQSDDDSSAHEVEIGIQVTKTSLGHQVLIYPWEQVRDQWTQPTSS